MNIREYALIFIFCSGFNLSLASEKPLVRQSFVISDSYYISAQKKIMVRVSYECGCGKFYFKFTNTKVDLASHSQDIDMELLSNNTCKALCQTWQTLSLIDFPDLNSNSDLKIHALGPNSESIHDVNFKKSKMKARSDSSNQGLLKKLKVKKSD